MYNAEKEEWNEEVAYFVYCGDMLYKVERALRDAMAAVRYCESMGDCCEVYKNDTKIY